MTEAEKKYADIINMPHHVSQNRSRMSDIDRAAQFSPFAALTGYDSTVAEAGRLTSKKCEISEDVKTILNEKMQMIRDYLDDLPFISVTYFVPDKRKAGGAYVTVSGVVKEISEYDRAIILNDKTTIPIEQICDIQGELFKWVE